MHELKLIVDLLHEGGLQRMYRFVSETAGFGSLSRGPRVVDARARDVMAEILAEVRDGRFAREWLLESRVGRPHFHARMQQESSHPIEAVGQQLRRRMPWLNEHDKAKPLTAKEPNQ